MESKITYQGHVSLYLEGEDALYVVENQPQERMAYYLFDPKSRIKITDFRPHQAQAAQQILAGLNGFEFADVFNQPAWAVVWTDSGETYVELYPPTSELDKEELPILWLGILHELEMPVQNIEWEILRAVNDTHVAFVVMVVKEEIAQRS